MNNLIDDIMEDLFSMAPELRDRREEVKAAAEKMVAARPKAALDAAFKTGLRERLMKEFAGLRVLRSEERRPRFGFHLSRPAMAVGGLLGLVIVVTLAMRPSGQTKQQANDLAQTSSSAKTTAVAALGQVRHLGAGAFGKLAMASAEEGQRTTASAAGAGEVVTTNGPTPTASPVAAMVAPDAMSFPYQPTRHEYRYAGELTLPTAPVEVLKVDRNIDAAAVSSLLRNVNLGPIDLGRFESAKVQSLNLIEDRDLGYVVNVDLSSGTANISQNWQRWPSNSNVQPLVEGDLPNGTEIIAVAQVFAEDYGLSLAGYGEPVVDKSWRRIAKSANDTSPTYVPDRLTVTYPLLVAGKPVYDQGGSVQGLSITVDVRLKKVTDAGPIALQNYLASAYEPVTDMSAVTKAISQGGVARWVDANAEKVVSHELEAPQEVLTVVWSYEGGQSTQLLVPALLFRVKDGAQLQDGEWFQETVVIPLAKDFYTDVTPGPIMYMKGGAEPAAAPTPSAAPEQR